QWQFLRGKRLLMSARGLSEKLTALEAGLLQILVSSPGHVFDREVLIQKLHGGQKRPTKRTIDLLIMNLRRKLDEPKGKHRHIITVAGSGYYFQA
ncbi:MAG: winged helix-turn-helix domain-containing protein, partial [Sphingomonadales bacterium]|nr:winged helix-turn-helix domain-containing protein [Sphingomonadales bacterium]